MFDKDDEINHESYGMIEITRTHSNKGKTLFGCSIKHSDTIRLRIREACEHRDLNRYWYFPKKELIEVEMSYSQFAEAITSLNHGGVPVTLKYINGKEVNAPEEVPQRELFEKEFKGKILDIYDKLDKMMDECTNILNKKGSILKKERSRMLNILQYLRTDIESNIPFIQKSFNDAMDKTVHDAKMEIEAYMNHKLISLGQEALKNSIDNNDKIEIDLIKEDT